MKRVYAFSIFILLTVFNIFSIYSQNKRITGRVQDNTGEIMVGVTIVEKGSNPINGTVTDIDGNYVIEVASSSSILEFSYLGYDSQEFRVGSASIIDVTLLESTSQLDEVVVLAFGGEKKSSDMIGSVSTVKTKDLMIPSSNLTTALQGQVAGVISYQRSGEPGQDDADFFIRGVTSFGTGKVNPLILIDGMELTVTDLARLRPDDIESFSIFKDATSTALYGARGANGVVYVTTKGGREGKPVLSFRAEGSYSAPTRNVEFADPVTYMKLYNEAQLARDPFAIPWYSTEKIERTMEGANPLVYPAVDWHEMLFKNYTLNHRYNLSVSGGGQVARYYVSASLSQDNGMLKVDKVNNFNNNVDLKKYTLRANVNINVTNSTELVVRLNGNFDNYIGPIDGGGEVYRDVVRSSPADFPAYFPKTEKTEHVQHIMFGLAEPRGARSFINPYANMVRGYREYDRSLMMAQIELKQKLNFITEGLSFRAMFNTNRTSRYDAVRKYNPFYYKLSYYDRANDEIFLDPINEDSGTEYLDYSTDANARQQLSVMYGEAVLNYDHTFNDVHAVSGMLVGLLRSETSAKAGNLELSLPSRNIGLSGRMTYSYDSRYYTEFNFGYNGSERFDADHRFGFFPSFGLAWSISNEEFWKNIKNVVSNFRLRYTYGLVGNDAIGSSSDRFFYLSRVNMDDANKGYVFGREGGERINGITVNRYANPNISWETAKKQNLAIEFGFFNKLNIIADIFKERRTNILMSRSSIPQEMGLTNLPRANIGEATGKGVDIATDFSHIFNKDVWLQVRGNFTFARTLYDVYEEPQYEKEWWLSRVGYPITQPWGYIAERLFVDDSDVANSPSQEFNVRNVAGDIKYKDINGDGQITTLDRVPIGYPTVPEINYGFGFSFGYKHFDISAFFTGVARTSLWIGGTDKSVTGPSNIQPFVDNKNILKVIADNHYSLENQDIYAFYPRLSTTHQNNNMQLSTWWLRDGSFFRMKQLELGYTLPDNIASSMYLSSLRFYINGSNLFSLSKFKLWDPEMGGNGLGYPLQRVFNFGLNLTF
ncbi:MAG: SusC/RagA family TonB-linked outer membrane protein [Fermentimonas sp.]|jgi:TonB-linked SusC/RagA family outer membrane protein